MIESATSYGMARPLQAGDRAECGQLASASAALVPVAQFTVPWGGQQVGLEQLSFAGGGAPLLRVRIREARRFTIFDVDAATAVAWGSAMADWGRRTLAQCDVGAPAGATGNVDHG